MEDETITDLTTDALAPQGSVLLYSTASGPDTTFCTPNEFQPFHFKLTNQQRSDTSIGEWTLQL